MQKLPRPWFGCSARGLQYILKWRIIVHLQVIQLKYDMSNYSATLKQFDIKNQFLCKK